MKRTNIYLHEVQTATLNGLARTRGVSRAELIRRLLDGALDGSQAENLVDDLAAIEQSFGVLGADDGFVDWGPDKRSRHLDRVTRL